MRKPCPIRNCRNCTKEYNVLDLRVKVGCPKWIGIYCSSTCKNTYIFNIKAKGGNLEDVKVKKVKSRSKLGKTVIQTNIKT